jgi:hypothetical protein
MIFCNERDEGIFRNIGTHVQRLPSETSEGSYGALAFKLSTSINCAPLRGFRFFQESNVIGVL